MKKSTLALVVMGITASASVQAAEVYNKNGNKLDLYGKVKAMHYMTDYDSKDGDQSYIRLGFKGETQINDQLTGYGRWEAEFAGNKAESDSNQQKTRLAFAGVKLKDFGSFDYGRNLGALYDYCGSRLTLANVRNDLALIEEVAGLIAPVAQSWSEIGPNNGAAAQGAGA